MLAISVNINIVIFLALLVAASFAGYFMRGIKISGYRKKILELEREMLSNHAEILKIEKEKADLVNQMKEQKSPVIQIKSKKEGDENRAAN